jgi:multisubunit Na+/H+ antiporter MnhB subunit
MKIPEVGKQRSDIAFLTILVLAISAIVLIYFPYSTPLTDGHFQVVEDLRDGRQVPYTPYSIGYLYLSALFLRWAGLPGILFMGFLIYAASVIFSYLSLRLLNLKRAAFFGAAAVACYPNLFLNIKRFHTVGFVALLLILFTYFLLHLRKGLTLRLAFWGGILFGIIILERTNLVSIVPLAIFAAVYKNKFGKRETVYLFFSMLLALAIFAAVIITAKGRLVFIDPFYAAYTFANGAHKYSFYGFLHEYNGELSMVKAFDEMGIPYMPLEVSLPELAKTYSHVAWTYILENPLRYLVLTGLKLVNLFRPDLRNLEAHNNSPFYFLIQLCIVGIFYFWAVLSWVYRKSIRWTDAFMPLPFLILYILPFVLTNTDLRYRLSFDPIFILAITYILAQLPRFKKTGSSEGALNEIN